jgi:hypothetical protein
MTRTLLGLVKAIPHVQCRYDANHDALDSGVSKHLTKCLPLPSVVLKSHIRSALPIAKVDSGNHTCVNWDRIDEWTGERTFTPSGENMKHPIYGTY